jgi:hypothetical protein
MAFRPHDARIVPKPATRTDSELALPAWSIWSSRWVIGRSSPWRVRARHGWEIDLNVPCSVRPGDHVWVSVPETAA